MNLKHHRLRSVPSFLLFCEQVAEKSVFSCFYATIFTLDVFFVIGGGGG